MDNAFFEGFEKEAGPTAFLLRQALKMKTAWNARKLAKAPGMVSKLWSQTKKIPVLGKPIYYSGKTLANPVGGAAVFTGMMATGRAAAVNTSPQRALGGYQGFR